MIHEDPAELEALAVRRAAKSLIETYGSTNAVSIAVRRAENAKLGGSLDAARTWAQIAKTLLVIGSSVSAERRYGVAAKPPRL
jgi:hypothetical protein